MSKPLKEKLDINALKHIGSVLKRCDNSPNTDKFISECSKKLDTFELKLRVLHIAESLHVNLPNDFTKTAKILQQIPNHWHNESEEAGWFDFAAWPLIDYVGLYGQEHPEISLALLKKLTHLFSAEFAIRAFIENHFEKTLTCMNEWVRDEDEHVRRLVSEGLRLRLPWAKNISVLFENVDKTLPLVLELVDDESLYVRKSVANHLNDLSKYHPELVKSTCKKILEKPTKNRQWLVKRALRTLKKNGIIS